MLPARSAGRPLFPSTRPRGKIARTLALCALVAAGLGFSPGIAAAAGKRPAAPRSTGSVATTRVGSSFRPVILSVRVGRRVLPATGGATSVYVRTRGASTCSLRVASHPWVRVTFVRQARPCGRGLIGVVIRLGPNTAPIRQPIVFDVVATTGTMTTVRAFGIAEAGQPPVERSSSTVPAPTSTTPTTTPPTTTPAGGPKQSTNWSGYVLPLSSSVFTDVSGQWTVPALDCSATPNAGMATWVGTGGYSWASGGNSGPLIQTGVLENCVNGVQQNSAWWEWVPSSPNESQEFSNLPVAAGDSIVAYVFQDGNGQWVTRVDDQTTGLSGEMVTGEGWFVFSDSTNSSTGGLQGSVPSVTYSGGYTAEWIVEDYSANGAPVPFADYGSVTFSGLETSLSPWSLTTDEGSEIVQGGVVLSTPSPPSGDGFSVNYTG